MHVDKQEHIGDELSTYPARNAWLDNPDPDFVPFRHPKQHRAHKGKAEHIVVVALRKGLEHQIDDEALQIVMPKSGSVQFSDDFREPWTGPMVRSRQVSDLGPDHWFRSSSGSNLFEPVKFLTRFSAQKQVPSYFWKSNNNPIYFKTFSRWSRLGLEWSCLCDYWCNITVVSINRLGCNFFGAWNYPKLTRTLNIISCTILSTKFR